jgi:iron complex outermembrane receptor protein
MKLRAATLSGLLATWIAGVAPAQDALTAGGESILFEDIPSVFGASKYEQRLEEAPSSVTIITADEIKKYGYRTLADIMRSQRGVYVTYDRNYTYMGVRGFSRPTDYNSRVLVLLDGHRTNENIFHMSLLGTEGILDVDTIDHIELIRGPSSSLYGTNALFAVVNVITKRGRDYQGAEVGVEAGSLHARKGRATYGTRLRGGTEVLASFSAYGSEGHDRLYFPEFDDPAGNDGIAENNDGDSARNAFLKFFRDDFTVEAAYVRRAKEVPTASYDSTFNDPRQGTLDRQGFIALQYDAELNDRQRVTARLSYDQYRYDGAYSNAWDENGDPTGELTEDWGEGRWWTAELQYTGRVADLHRYVLGAEIQYNAQQDQGNVTVEPYTVWLDDERTSHQWSLFAQDEWRLRANLILNVGLRHDYYSEWGGTTNPRLALIYLATAATTAKLLYGQAYRAPSPYELYYTPSPWLDPETISTVELTIEHTLRGNLRAVASLYQYEVNDLIDQQEDFTFINTGDAFARGVEFELEGRLNRLLEGRLNYSYQRARDDDTGWRMSNSPRHLVKLNLSAPVVANQLHAGLEVQYVSARKTLADAEAAGYTVANLTLFSRRWVQGLEMSASVYNLTDKAYADPGGQEHVQDTIAQDGRAYRVKVQYEFQ